MRARKFPRSSMIDRIGYDDQTGMLCIAFRDTGRYLYDDVPPHLFELFCKAPSAGAFFNRHIKGQFRCRLAPGQRRFGPKAWTSDANN